MRSIYALIPAALLAGTVLSDPVEATGTANFSLISRHDYFTVMNAKKIGKIKINKIGSLKARKAYKKAAGAGKAAKAIRKTASVKPHKKAAGAGKATKDVYKTARVKPHKELVKLALNDRKQETVSVAAPKQAEIKPRKTAHGEPASMKLAKLALPDKKQETVSVAEPKQAEIKPRKIAYEDPVSLSKVLRSGPREVKNVVSGEAESQQALIATRMTTLKDGGQELFASKVDSSSLVKLSQPPAVKETIENLQAGGASKLQVVEIIREMAPSHGVPIWFALRIAFVESSYNPYARGLAGEIGIFQLKCQTARGIGFEGDCSALTDVRTNVHWGLKHLSLAIASSGGNLRLAASKHNAGLARKSLVDSYVAKVF